MRDTVTIDTLTYGGAGFGRLHGKACFVPFTAPGDMVEVRVVRDKKSFFEAELRKIVEPSSLREPAPCPVFGTCGGCTWQHLSYAAQLKAKHAIVSDMLWRFGRIDPACIDTIVPSPEEYGYRSRVQFKTSYRSGRLCIGFYRAGTHTVVPLPVECAIASPSLNRIVRDMEIALNQTPDPEHVSQIDVATGETDGVIIIVHYLGSKRDSLMEVLAGLRQVDTVTGVFIQGGRNTPPVRVWGEDRLSYCVPVVGATDEELDLSFSRGGFSQVNYRQNRSLVNNVCTWAGLTGTERVLDLFCGNGNFSLPLARNAKSVVGIEGNALSIEDARYNAERNGIGNVEFHCQDAHAAVQSLVAAGDIFDCVVLDPPRAGARDVVRNIAALAPRSIVYISCDPATLSRDAGIFSDAGYRVTACRLHDMFPQTYHIETVTLLERS
jgi:23S rRNA (uracil1939-C5)-methyltransferase